MKLNIKRREVGFFFLGAFAFFAIDFVSDWDTNSEAAKRGFIQGWNDASTEQTISTEKKAE